MTSPVSSASLSAKCIGAGAAHSQHSLRRMLAAQLTQAATDVVGAAALASVSLRDAGLNAPKHAGHGDFASPLALALAKHVKRPPRELATAIVAALGDACGLLTGAEVAGPGHINCTVSKGAWHERLWLAFTEGSQTLTSDVGAGQRVLIEFVSANPTGPLHLAHGRGAVYGDVLANLLTAAGYAVTREYYVNDLGSQTEVLAQSVWAHLEAQRGKAFVEPPAFYPGAYVEALAAELRAAEMASDETSKAAAAPAAKGERPAPTVLTGPDLARVRDQATERMLARIKADLHGLGVAFDSFVSERAMAKSSALGSVLQRLRDGGHLYDEDGKVWFRTTALGDDKDRVLVREDGRPTYVLGDIAYHEQKVVGGYSQLINVWGADHGGYEARVRAGLIALGHEAALLRVDYVQMVSIAKGGQALKMGKRLGTAVWLQDVIDETGRDAVRFWFLLRRLDAQMELDIELAAERSLKNPVYYAQMGHARLCAIERRALALGVELPAVERSTVEDLAALVLPEERAIALALARAPDVIADAATAHEPHAVVAYLQELIGLFHSYYGQYKHTERVVSDDAAKTKARLLMCRGLANVLRGLLALLGVAAPQEMELLPPPEQAGEQSKRMAEQA